MTRIYTLSLSLVNVMNSLSSILLIRQNKTKDTTRKKENNLAMSEVTAD